MTNYEQIFAMHVSEIGPISFTFKELLKFNEKKNKK